MKTNLTIITPTLNSLSYLPGCVNCVREQGCAELEHIIVDGGSSDGSRDYINSIQSDNPHLRFIVEAGSSQSKAMNVGIRQARGSVLGCLNADDYYEPGTLKRALEIMHKLPEPSFIVGNCLVRDDRNQIMRINKPDRLTLFSLLVGAEPPNNPVAYFYHKSLHDRIGPYDESDHYTMDLDFILRAVQVAHVHYFDENWGNFRWIKGAKTYDSLELGSMFRRIDAVRDRHLMRQAGWFRLLVRLKRRQIALGHKIRRRLQA